jgi:hypothetical protein
MAVPRASPPAAPLRGRWRPSRHQPLDAIPQPRPGAGRAARHAAHPEVAEAGTLEREGGVRGAHPLLESLLVERDVDPEIPHLPAFPGDSDKQRAVRD